MSNVGFNVRELEAFFFPAIGRHSPHGSCRVCLRQTEVQESHFSHVFHLLCSLRVAGHGGLITQVRINSRIFHDAKQSEEQDYTALMARDNY